MCEVITLVALGHMVYCVRVGRGVGVLQLQMGLSNIMAVFRQSDVTTTHTFGGWGVCNVGVGEQCGRRGGVQLCGCGAWLDVGVLHLPMG